MRIAAAMSGGVDSSVAALLLAREGAEVVGLSMHLWDHDRDGRGAAAGRCCTLDDLHVARRAAERIGIPHYVLDLTERFRDAVVRPFVAAYLSGETPIPCTVCNTEVKFQSLLSRAAALGCEAVATGHYARVERREGGWRLRKGLDPAKDQSYFLWDLTGEQLARARFPVGAMRKEDVRALAREAGLPNWDKPDSQEICFVPREGPAEFIRREAEALGLPLPARGGVVVDAEGKALGAHAGTFAFTVGQRRGIGVASGEPLYVTRIEPAAGRVVVGTAEELRARTVLLRAVRLHRVDGVAAGAPLLRVLARVRSRHVEQPATLELGEGATGRLFFDEPVRAAAPGQSAVFYDAGEPDLLLGGGTISGSAP